MLTPALLIAIASIAFQDQPSPPATLAPLFSERDVRLIQLERETQALRDEVRRELADAAFLPEQATDQARGAWNLATQQRKLAEANAKLADEKHHYAILEKTANIELAQSTLEEVRKRQAETNRAVERGQQVNPYLRISIDLEADRAGFEVEQAETERDVLTKYLGPREAERLKAQVLYASAEEQIKKDEYDIQNQRVQRRRAESARALARTPEDLVVALLDEVVQEETRIIDFVREAAAIQTRMATDPDHASTYLDQIKKNRDAIENTTRQVKERLTEATTIADEVRRARQKLFEAEKRLILERRLAEPPPP